VNNLSIVGRIGKVGELRYTQGGKAVINLSVAVDNGKDSNGEKRAATWFEVALWEKQAEALAQYLVVGDRVGINGQARLQVDEGNDGKKYPKLTVDFPRVELLGGSSKPETQAAPRQAARPAQRPAQRQAAAQVDDDINF
jgi:single-strand DNA-binding protein